jgi:hypothetical protein
LVTRPPLLRRFASVLWLVVLVVTLTSRLVVAQSNVVPAELQAELLSKLLGYDRSFLQRAGDKARLLILTKADNVRSAISASEMKSAMAQIDRVGGLPHEETVARYEGADALAARCKSDRIAAVYLTPGFADDLPQLRATLSGVDVLTAGAVADYVPDGVVLGFDLESGKPKLLINLEQAKRQNVNFPADVLRLMKVYR